MRAAANATIAHRSNLCFIDVLDALTGLPCLRSMPSPPRGHRFGRVCGYVLTYGRIAIALCIAARPPECASWRSALSGLSAIFISHNGRGGYNRVLPAAIPTRLPPHPNRGITSSPNSRIDRITFSCGMPPMAKLQPKYSMPCARRAAIWAATWSGVPMNARWSRM